MSYEEEQELNDEVLLSKEEFQELCHVYGGAWCDCIRKVIDAITPEKLAVYCAGKYEQFRQAESDEIGVRYAYKLKVVKLSQREGDFEIVREQNILADFGAFFHRPVETLQSVLKAIIKIAEHEKRRPHDVALEVAEADEARADFIAPIKKTVADSPQMRAFNSAKKFMQADGSLRSTY